MRYSKQKLARLFLDWPAYRDSENLDMVIERVDVIRAVARLEDISYESAELAMDRAWNTLRSMGTLGFVTGAIAFADQLLGEVNRVQRNSNQRQGRLGQDGTRQVAP